MQLYQQIIPHLLAHISRVLTKVLKGLRLIFAIFKALKSLKLGHFLNFRS